MKLALKPVKKPRKPSVAQQKSIRPSTAKRVLAGPAPISTARSARAQERTTPSQWTTGIASGASGVRRYRLFKPSGMHRGESLPLVVMLHGCAQDAHALAASTKMNRLAQVERFMVLYPEQDRLANLQNCWNWYDTRAGRAQREADTIVSAVDHLCLTQPVDPQRMAVVGLSAGAGLAGLLAVHQPQRFQAVVMHSGIAPGLASSSATALAAMRGRRVAIPLAPLAGGLHLPAILVIQGSIDPIVAPSNGAQAAHLWADREGARAGKPRSVQRGKRYPTMITDFRCQGRLVATLCLIQGLGHAWSGGAPGLAYSDPKGPDASRMAWSFMQRQFATQAGGTG
ncbi:PHB depolymerase family esterase [Rhodoferax sp. U11-2br]|uniref:extracellular catalytic domain type 1 short-chain-length polyhydroxyalkanoate depolymerase n=1 Tax=Rhodoferax sp. U11-2br TaxID=2838878 RepID=UPI0021111651|nr:PHB depolymerase family esterase [Rhodoferax sp. U11-2br]